MQYRKRGVAPTIDQLLAKSLDKFAGKTIVNAASGLSILISKNGSSIH